MPFNFPYTDFHELNLDWIINAIHALQKAVKLPPGGGTGQALVKKSPSNYDVGWETISGGGSTELFYCTYGTTTSAQIEAAITNGLLPIVKYNNIWYYLTERTSNHYHSFNSVYRFDSHSIDCISDSWIVYNESFASQTYVNNQIAAIPNLIPSGGTSGYVLSKASNTDYDVTWTAPGGGGTVDVEWVTYGTTTSAEIEAAYQAGKIVACIYNNYIFYLTERTNANTHYFTSVRQVNSRYVRCYNNNWTFSTTTLASQSWAQSEFIAEPVIAPTTGDYLAWSGTAWVAQSLPLYNGGVG